MLDSCLEPVSFIVLVSYVLTSFSSKLDENTHTYIFVNVLLCGLFSVTCE